MKKILLSSIALLTAALILGWVGYLNIGHWLSVGEAPHSADAIICLASGNVDDRIKQSVSLVDNGFSDTILATTDKTYIGLTNKKIHDTALVRPKRDATTTYEEGLFLRQQIIDAHIRSALIVSAPFHLFRVRWTFEHIYQDVPVQFSYISSDPEWAQGFWWDNRRSRLFVLSELPKIPYYWIAHGLLGLEHNPEWVVGVKRWYERKLREMF